MTPEMRLKVLAQADRVAPDPYRPVEMFRSYALELAVDGRLSPNQLGGFSITADGSRELARLRAK